MPTTTTDTTITHTFGWLREAVTVKPGNIGIGAKPAELSIVIEDRSTGESTRIGGLVGPSNGSSLRFRVGDFLGVSHVDGIAKSSPVKLHPDTPGCDTWTEVAS